LTLVACGSGGERSEIVRKSPLETAIARELTGKLGEPASATCAMAMNLPVKCEAALADGTKLPIEIESDGKEWAWRVAGRVVETAPLVAYVNASLADLRVAQQANCGRRIVFVAPDDRVGCKLSGGGMAFVRFATDGTISLELDIDPASAAARGEVVTPARDLELTTTSRALEAREGESDGEEEVSADGGVPKP
jgi:hypothetical protein